MNGRNSKEKNSKVNRTLTVCFTALALSITILVCVYFIFYIGVSYWSSTSYWILGLFIFGVFTISFYFVPLINRQLHKKLVGYMLLCIIFATPIFAVSSTIRHHNDAQNLSDPQTIDYFKTLLDRSYNYTELIEWENQQLNFSGTLRSNDPIKIYENHQGMCGEFATLYATLCISQGYRCRVVVNVFNDHTFNEVLFPNGTWIRVDASLNDTSPRAIGYPMFFKNENGWMPPILSLAFENSTITEVTSTYNNGFTLLSPTTLTVLSALFAVLIIPIRNELLVNPKSSKTKCHENEKQEKIAKKENEQERKELIYEIAVKRHNQESHRTNTLDSKINITIGSSGLIAVLMATVFGFFTQEAYSVLFIVPFTLLIVSAILRLHAYRVSTVFAESTTKNHGIHNKKAKLIKYATGLLVLAITLFFVIAISNWLI